MATLLAVDVGNTNTVLGVFAQGQLVAHWRIQTVAARTSDEYAVLLKTLLELEQDAPKTIESSGSAGARSDAERRGVTIESSGSAGARSDAERRGVTIDAGIISSVVPPAVFGLQQFFKRHCGGAALVVGPGIKTGMPILYENPREVGADRIVNAVAAYEQLKAGCIVVDFGTATTWDVVTPKGEYLGGVIAPGIQISAEALYEHAAKLPRVELARPGKVVARNTIASMQAGLVYGYAGMVDALVERIRAELDYPARCIATGGLAPLIATETKTIEACDELLTLKGLDILFRRNQS
ncbi:MAG TPA: type III pantothenate kinase [Kofleriaceae bacterium]|nr:type III pantothenate kinase [Kofleriaceae bacterium]